jgi:hypothetical protein
MATIYRVETFSDIISAVQEELGADSNDTKVTNRIKRDINMVYMQGIAAKKQWHWLRRRIEVQTLPFFSTGTASVTATSTTVTLTESPAVSYKGFYFSTESYNERYRVAQHTANTSTLVLESAYTGTTNATATFKLWTNTVPLPPDTRETLKVTHSFRNTPLENLGAVTKFNETEVTAPKVEGRPSFYTTGRLVKAAPFEAVGSLPATATRASSAYIRTIKFAATLGADEDTALLAPGDKIELSAAGHQDYNGRFTIAQLSTTDNANDTITFVAETKKTEAAVADTTISVTKKSREDNDSRYREFMFYPSIYDTAVTLEIERIVEPLALEEDDDEPLIPIEDRSILVYGALSRQHLKESNPEVYGINRAEFEAKYAEMASTLEDSTDHAQLKISKNYMRGKRRIGTRGSAIHPTGLSGFGAGGGSSQILGTADRAAVFNSDGKLVSSTLISTTELDYLNGVTSNIQTQIDTKITGPGSATDNALTRYDGTSGTLTQDSSILLDDSDNLTGVNGIELVDKSAPSNPGAGKGELYKKTGDDGIFWKPDAAGAEVDLSAGVTGPGSSTDNAIARWNGTGGGVIQDSSVLISDSDAVTGITKLTVDNIDIDGNTISSTSGDITLTPTADIDMGGTADYVVINSATGKVSEEAQLANTRGGTGIDTSASTGVAKVASGTWSVATVVDADISASAAITKTKLATGTADRVEITDGSGNITESAITSTELTYLNDVVAETDVSLSDNQGAAADVVTWSTTFTYAAFTYTIKRGSSNIRGGMVEVIHDGTNTNYNETGPVDLGTVGVTLTADVSGGDVRLRYTSTSTGTAPTFRYKLNRIT